MADVSVTITDSTSVDVTTSAASSVNITSSTPSAVSVTEKGPKGDTGATGATGATGPQGPAGSDGTSPNAFTTLAVAGQDNVVADATDDTLTLAAGSNVTITTNASSDTVTIASADTNTQLSTEQVQDIAGPLVATGGTKTGITVTYDDTNGNMDFVVDDLHNVGVDGSVNQLLTDDGDGTVTSQGNLKYDSTNEALTLSSGTSTKPSFFISNSNADAEAPLLALSKSTAGADGDDLGRIQFDGFDPDGNDQTFVKLLGEIVVAADGSEEGKLTIDVASHDGELQSGLIIASGNAEDEVDVTVGNTATSVTTIAGTLTMGSTATLDNSGNLLNNAATATALATARAINGVNFDGTAPITVTAAGSTLSDEVPVSKGGTGATSFTSNAVLTGNSTSAIQAESALTYDATADTLQLTSSTGGYPRIELKSEANVTGGQRFVFIKDRGAAPADGDTLGIIRWEGEDSGQNATAYAQIFAKIAETTDGQEGGQLSMQVASHDGEMVTGLELVDGDAEDEIDVNIGSGAGSLTTVMGTLTPVMGITLGHHLVNDIDVAGEFVDSDEHLMTSAAINDRIAAVGGSDGWHGSTTRIKILPRDFIADDGGRPLFVDDTNIGIEQLFLESFSSNPMYASIAIPTGFKATHVKINGSATDAVEVWEFQIDSKTGVSKGTGNVGTEIDITDVTSSTTNYLFIGIANASGNEVHGGYVTIAAV